ncbi:M3 family metallopeptidase [Streptomyces sp. NPDC006649]|uniref:M3 family metallopeptidase n=1 Tax=Streptomyces sp. NPDC006649 TaxID=3156896 RepID=UPI0033A4DC5E
MSAHGKKPLTLDSLSDSTAPRWDIASLFPDPQSAAVDELLGEPLREAQKIAADYTGVLAGLDAESLRVAIQRYENCVARIQEASCYGELLRTDVALRPRAVALLSRCDRAWAELASTLAFFETELGTRTSEAPDDLGPYVNFVGKVRAGSSGNLSDVQESILAQLLPTGGEGWERLSQQLLRAISVDLDGASHSIAETVPRLYEADREARLATHAAIGAALADQAELRAFALSMTVADSETRAGIRGTDWLRERRLFDQVTRAELDALLAASDECLPLIHSYYALKREILGVDDFADYDRYAPVGPASPEITWAAAVHAAISVMESISPAAAELSRTMFENGRIDAAPRPGKGRSAYTQSIPGQLPCISMNFRGNPRDVLTLVHETGHAVYLQLAAGQPYLAATPAPVMAETFALFCEGLAVRQQLAGTADPAVRLRWLARWLEDQMVAIGRHAALHRFEVALHDRVRDGAELDAAHIGALWTEGQRRLYGPAVRLTEGYGLWWSYLDSLFTAPGSNYAYVYGQLSALTLLRHFEADPHGVGSRLTATLRLGDTRKPADLLTLVTGDPGRTWHDALAQLTLSLDELRALTDFRSPHPAGSGKSTPRGARRR